MCPLRNMLYLTWYVIAPPTFTVLSTFYTNKGVFSLSNLNPFLFANWVSMNNLVAPLSSSALTATLSWFSSFFNPIPIHTSLSGCSVYHISLTPSVLLDPEILIPSFSRHSILYIFEEASQKLTVLHCLLLTLAVFLLFCLPFLFSTNSFWPCGPIFHIQNMFYPLFFLYLHPLHWGLFLALVDFYSGILLYSGLLASM